MVEHNNPITMIPLTTLVSYFQPHQELPAKVSSHSPAILCMTDFRQTAVVTIEPNVSIEWAHHRMKEYGVHLLLVVNSAQQVLGLITSTDILGEKPMQLRTNYGRKHVEIMVREIMTPHDLLEVMMMDDVLHASVEDVVESMRRVGRRHALVLDADRRTRKSAIRGLFSLNQICRQLGKPMEDVVEVATTFMELEVALNQ